MLGKGWFVALRMYRPLEPPIEKTWRPGEIELVKKYRFLSRGKSRMNTQSILQRAMHLLLLLGPTVFLLAPAHAADAPTVSASNYVRVESDM